MSASQARVGGAHQPDLGFELAEFIEQFALRVAAHQRLEFVLAVDVEQQFADAAQHRHRHALAVDPGAAPPIAADDPAQQQLALVRDRLLFEHVAQLAADAGDIDAWR